MVQKQKGHWFGYDIINKGKNLRIKKKTMKTKEVSNFWYATV